jgi:hypothetical protein
MSRLRLLVTALSALVLVAALAACGSSGSEERAAPEANAPATTEGRAATARPVSARTLASVASRTAGSQTARFALVMQQTLPGSTEPVSLTADGAFDTASGRAMLTMDMSAFAAAFGGGAGGSANDWHIEAVQDGAVIYMRMPMLTKQLPGGKEWVMVDVRRQAAQRGLDLSQLGMQSADPRATLEYLKAVAGKVRTLGTETVRGVPTTHYRAVVDVRRYLRSVPAAQRNAFGNLDQLVGQAGLAKLPLELWVDADGLARRMTMVFTMTPAGQPVTTSFSMELFDYGKPVAIDLPPRDAVADLAALGLTG